MDFPCPIYQFYTVGQTPIYYPVSMPIVQCAIAPKDQGLTYGEQLRRIWQTGDTNNGCVVLEHDVAVSLESWYELAELITLDPRHVACVPFVLYPASTNKRLPIWANQRKIEEGVVQTYPANLPPPMEATTFGLGCTYLPARLLALLPEDLQHWTWPALDWRLSTLAMDEGIRVNLCQTPAVHLHY